MNENADVKMPNACMYKYLVPFFHLLALEQIMDEQV